MLNILASSDNEWKYTFIIVMTLILIVCGIYVTLKIKIQDNKKTKSIDINNSNDKYTKAILDNEDIIIQKKKN